MVGAFWISHRNSEESSENPCKIEVLWCRNSLYVVAARCTSESRTLLVPLDVPQPPSDGEENGQIQGRFCRQAARCPWASSPSPTRKAKAGQTNSRHSGVSMTSCPASASASTTTVPPVYLRQIQRRHTATAERRSAQSCNGNLKAMRVASVERSSRKRGSASTRSPSSQGGSEAHLVTLGSARADLSGGPCRKSCVRRATRKTSATSAKWLESPMHGHAIDGITRRDIVAIIDTMQPVAGDRAKSALSGLYAWAIDKGYLDINPTMNIRARAQNGGKDARFGRAGACRRCGTPAATMISAASSSC